MSSSNFHGYGTAEKEISGKNIPHKFVSMKECRIKILRSEWENVILTTRFGNAAKSSIKICLSISISQTFNSGNPMNDALKGLPIYLLQIVTGVILQLMMSSEGMFHNVHHIYCTFRHLICAKFAERKRFFYSELGTTSALLRSFEPISRTFLQTLLFTASHLSDFISSRRIYFRISSCW